MSDTAVETVACCPNCGRAMTLVATAPHCVTALMEKHTYSCTPCKQTKIYMLPVK